MLQLFLRSFTQTVVDHAVHIAGAALIQILFSNFAVAVITANLQLIHAVRMLGEQSLELMNQNPGSRLPDVLMHSRTYTTNHPAVTVAATNLCTNFLCFRTVPQLVPSLVVQVAHDLFVLGAIARHNIAIRIDEEGIETHVARQQTLLAVDVVDQTVVKVCTEPLLRAVATEQFVDQIFKVLCDHRTVVDDVLSLNEVEAVVLTLDREERKMSLGIKQLKQDPWETIEEKYPVGSKHTAKVRNFTNFGVFVEIEEGVDGLIHISDLSWTKKVKHPSEFTQIGADIEVQVLEIDKENRRLSLGHKQLEENPWDVFETVFTVGSVHEGTIIEMLDKGAVVALPYGVEGFATPKHLVKEDGSQAQLDEKLEFKVIEFNKDAKRIILSHSRIFEDVAKAEERAEKKAASGAKKSSNNKREDAPMIQNQAASTTLGDIDALAALKEQLEGKK